MDVLLRPFSTPVGELLLGSFGESLCLCDWTFRSKRKEVDARIQRSLSAWYRKGTSPVIEQAMDQLDAYFAGDRKVFDVPLLPLGTAFQRRTWEALQGIPFGATIGYGRLSEQVADRMTIRAVAAANGANALSIFIPCHRVVGSDGCLVGYAGGLVAKRALLVLERTVLSGPPGLFDGLQQG